MVISLNLSISLTRILRKLGFYSKLRRQQFPAMHSGNVLQYVMNRSKPVVSEVLTAAHSFVQACLLGEYRDCFSIDSKAWAYNYIWNGKADGIPSTKHLEGRMRCSEFLEMEKKLRSPERIIQRKNAISQTDIKIRNLEFIIMWNWKAVAIPTAKQCTKERVVS